MDKLTLSLTVDQINVIFAALGRMPYESVFTLISEINAQLTPQLKNQSQELETRTLPDNG